MSYNGDKSKREHFKFLNKPTIQIELDLQMASDLANLIYSTNTMDARFQALAGHLDSTTLIVDYDPPAKKARVENQVDEEEWDEEEEED